MDNHKRRFATSAKQDIITNLSDHLIDQILERLPIEDAVRTSILSKKWRYRWTTIKILNFNDPFIKKLSNNGAFSQNGFIRIINKIMINHNGPIFKFALSIPKIVLDSFQEIDQWMLICSRNNVRELVLANSNIIYALPPTVFSCLQLRKLAIHKCIFKPPFEFQGFPNLEHIYFSSIDFGGNLGITVINLPQLKELRLKSCVNVNNFNIKAVNLRTLCVIGCPDAMLLRLLHSENLDVVCVYLQKPIKDLRRVERFNLATMLSYLPSIVYFAIDGFFLEFLAAERFPKWLPYAVKSLRHLEIPGFSFCDLDQVQGALCILRNSPNLQLLRVPHVRMGRVADLELTSNYLESPNCLQTLFMLHTVEITSLEGSRQELLFIKLLLDHSPDLENMIIRPKATAVAEKRLNIAKCVMMFPRASPKAKMFFLDPQP